MSLQLPDEAALDPAMLAKLLSETLAAESAVEHEIEQFSAGRGQHADGAELGREVSLELDNVKACSSSLLGSIGTACAIAETVSAKVRELDVARTRLQQVAQNVEQAAARRDAAAEIGRALAAGDHARAASAAKPFSDSSESHPSLHDAILRLRREVKAQFEAVTSKGDGELDRGKVREYAYLFPDVGLREEGAELFAKQLRREVRLEADAVRKELTGAQAAAAGNGGVSRGAADLQAISSLFEIVAGTIVELGDELLQRFGTKGVVIVLNHLQAECDEQARRMIDRYRESVRLEDVVRRVRGDSSTDIAVDPREMSGLLAELADLSSKAAQYEDFMSGKAAAALEGADSSSAGAPAGLVRSKLREYVQGTVADYLVIEEHTLRTAISKALKLDQVIEGSLITSAVDDVFIVSKLCVARSLDMRSKDSIVALVNIIAQEMRGGYIAFLEAGIRAMALGGGIADAFTSEAKDGLKSLATDLGIRGSTLNKVGSALRSQSATLAATAGVKLAEAGEGRRQREQVALAAARALNNAQTSAEYLRKLAEEVDRGLGQLPKPGEGGEMKEELLRELREIAGLFDGLLAAAFEKQLVGSLKDKLSSLCKRVELVKYEIDEFEYAEYEVNDPFAVGFVDALGEILYPWHERLTQENFDALAEKVARRVASQLEAIMLEKNFSQFGGFQLERDARTVSSFFSELTERVPMRSKFKRLMQMAGLLGIEALDEAIDFVRLSGSGEEAGQVRHILLRRKDLDSQEVHKLRL